MRHPKKHKAKLLSNHFAKSYWTQNGKTALYYAKRESYDDIVQLIEEVVHGQVRVRVCDVGACTSIACVYAYVQYRHPSYLNP